MASSPPMTYKRSEKRVKDLSDEEFIEQLKENYDLQNYDVTLISGQNSLLKKSDMDKYEQSAESVVITHVQLELGLRIPLYNTDSPFYYEVLSQLKPYRSLAQWTGNTFRIMDEWRNHRDGNVSNADWSTYKPEDAPEYTVANFIANYRAGTSTNGELAGFAASPHRHRSMPKNVERMMLDADPLGQGYNRRHRHTNDPIYPQIPLLVRGLILHGSFSSPTFPAEPYPFWVVNDDKDDKPQGDSSKASTSSRKRGAGTRFEEDQGKKCPRHDDDEIGGSDVHEADPQPLRRNPSRGKQVVNPPPRKRPIIDIYDEDEIFGDDFSDDKGDGKEMGDNVGPEVVVNDELCDKQEPMKTPELGKTFNTESEVLRRLPHITGGSSSGVETSFNVFGPILNSLGALTSPDFGAYTDEKMLGAVPLYGDIAQTLDTVILNRVQLDAANHRRERDLVESLQLQLQNEKGRARDLEIKLADAQAMLQCYKFQLMLIEFIVPVS